MWSKGKTDGCYPLRWRFESSRPSFVALSSNGLGHEPFKLGSVGSNPTSATICWRSSEAERVLGKDEVTGSSPVVSSSL